MASQAHPRNLTHFEPIFLSFEKKDSNFSSFFFRWSISFSMMSKRTDCIVLRDLFFPPALPVHLSVRNNAVFGTFNSSFLCFYFFVFNRKSVSVPSHLPCLFYCQSIVRHSESSFTSVFFHLAAYSRIVGPVKRVQITLTSARQKAN